MTKEKLLERRFLSLPAAATALALAFLGLVTAPSSCALAGPVPGAAPSLATPLATSAQTSDGTWATLPMGHLDQPENTFWQLFFRPPGAASWSDQAQATATATNGGLVLASDGGRSLIVGVRPSQYLTYSPLIATSDGARSWSDGLVADRLAARPDALAATANGQALALVAGPDGGQVLTTAGGISAWRTLATERQLAAGAGRSCGLGLLTAVGYVGGQAVIGGSCSRPGGVGLFAFRGGAWRSVGAAVPRSLDHGRVEVLALEPGQGQASALLAVADGDQTSLVAGRSTPEGQWSTSPPLTLATNQDLASFGPAEGTGIFVLLKSTSGTEDLVVSNGPSAWRRLPSPPGGTKTVAFGTAQTVTALAASATVLTVWSLRSTSGPWAKSQVMNVPVQFGSSG
jgi:hypothetical protein